MESFGKLDILVNNAAFQEHAERLEDRTGWAHQIIPKHSDLPYRFDEMEYALPYEVGMECFWEVRERVRARWRASVGWRVLYRVVAADDAYLSAAHGRIGPRSTP